MERGNRVGVKATVAPKVAIFTLMISGEPQLTEGMRIRQWSNLAMVDGLPRTRSSGFYEGGILKRSQGDSRAEDGKFARLEGLLRAS